MNFAFLLRRPCSPQATEPHAALDAGPKPPSNQSAGHQPPRQPCMPRMCPPHMHHPTPGNHIVARRISLGSRHHLQVILARYSAPLDGPCCPRLWREQGNVAVEALALEARTAGKVLDGILCCDDAIRRDVLPNRVREAETMCVRGGRGEQAGRQASGRAGRQAGRAGGQAVGRAGGRRYSRLAPRVAPRVWQVCVAGQRQGCRASCMSLLL